MRSYIGALTRNINMRVQDQSKQETNCIACDNTIYRSERRRVDGSMHFHFKCPPKPDEDDQFWRLLINRVRG